MWTGACARGGGCSLLAFILEIFGMVNVLPWFVLCAGVIFVTVCLPSWRRGGFLVGFSTTCAGLP